MTYEDKTYGKTALVNADSFGLVVDLPDVRDQEGHRMNDAVHTVDTEGDKVRLWLSPSTARALKAILDSEEAENTLRYS
jgi:hypothetical protein